MDFDHALGTVMAAKNLADRARSLMPEGVGFPEARALIYDERSEPTLVDRPDGVLHLKLAITVFSRYLDRHFRNEKEGNLLIMETVTVKGNSGGV